MNNLRFVLLVEDNDDDALLLAHVVSRASLGIQLSRVHNGQQGIDYLLGAGEFSDRSQFPWPHIIMLDLKMPICDGFDFLEWKRRQHALACLPTIVMTSSDYVGDVRRSYELGAHSFTMKVKTAASLNERIDALREWWFEHSVLLSPGGSASGADEYS